MQAKHQPRKQNLWQAFLEKSFNITIPVVAILAAFAISGLLILGWGSNPIAAYKAIFQGAFGSPNAIATTLTRMTPLVFTGLAVAYGYKAGFFNVGAEGQLYMGALAATWVGVTFTNWPGWLLVIACFLAASLAGAFLALIPAYLKAKRGFNEVLTTLLFNYIVMQFFAWSLRIDHPMAGVDEKWGLVNWFGIKDPTQPYPKSAFVAEQSWLPSVNSFLKTGFINSIFGGTHWYQASLAEPALERITLAPLLAVLGVIIVFVLMFKTTIGFRARAVGVSPDAARAMGINVSKTILVTALISGTLAGLAGAMEILGTQHRVMERFLVDAGFTGIPVALIGQLHPVGAWLSAFFFGALRAGANRMQITTAVPVAMVYVIQALTILFAIAGTTIELVSYFKKSRMTSLSERAEEERLSLENNEVLDA
ncbi:MAG: ABC transporter permease [Anaerolineaceae bacterium]|nr:ABC transporter permease [Anaerolineaceae bacterium]